MRGRNERIRELRARGATLSAIAGEFDLSRQRIAQIVGEPMMRAGRRMTLERKILLRERWSDPNSPEAFFLRERFG